MNGLVKSITLDLSKLIDKSPNAMSALCKKVRVNFTHHLNRASLGKDLSPYKTLESLSVTWKEDNPHQSYHSSTMRYDLLHCPQCCLNFGCLQLSVNQLFITTQLINISAHHPRKPYAAELQGLWIYIFTAFWRMKTSANCPNLYRKSNRR